MLLDRTAERKHGRQKAPNATGANTGCTTKQALIPHDQRAGLSAKNTYVVWLLFIPTIFENIVLPHAPTAGRARRVGLCTSLDPRNAYIYCRGVDGVFLILPDSSSVYRVLVIEVVV